MALIQKESMDSSFLAQDSSHHFRRSPEGEREGMHEWFVHRVFPRSNKKKKVLQVDLLGFRNILIGEFMRSYSLCLRECVYIGVMFLYPAGHAFSVTQ